MSKRIKIETALDFKKGKREYMEDRIIIHKKPKYYLSGIFDGHGGYQCSEYLKKMFYKEFIKQNKKKQTMRKTLVETSKKLNKDILKKRWGAGSTANVLVIDKKANTFYMANTGDSRGFAVYKNGKVKQLSIDHKPNTPKEKKRILKSGGFVKDGRVDGILAIGRAYGDKEISKHLTALPDVTTGSTKLISYFFQASDGIFDVFTNTQIKSLISFFFKKGIKINAIAKKITALAIKKGSMDNVSLVITLIS